MSRTGNSSTRFPATVGIYRPGFRHLIRPDDRKLAPGWQQLGHNFGHRFPGAAGQRFGHEILEQAGGKVKKRLFKICYYFT